MMRLPVLLQQSRLLDNSSNATNDTSLAFDMDIDYRYMTDRMYYGLAAIGIFTCFLSFVGASSILYFLLISNPRNGKKRIQQISSSATGQQQEERENNEGGSFLRRLFKKKPAAVTESNDDTLEKLGLYHRLLVGLSAMDWINATSSATQTLMLPQSTQYPLALGNTATCRTVAFFFQGFLGSYLYSAALSLYFYLTIRRGKKEQEAAAILEPYAHIVSIAIPILWSVLGLSLDMFRPSAVFMNCFFVYPHEIPECVMSTPAQQEANGLHCTTSSIQFLVGASLSIIGAACVVTGMVVTLLIYRTVRQQTVIVRRHALDGQASDPQLSRTRAVGRQAILYFLVYLSGFLVTILTSFMAKASGRKIGDPTDMYGSTMLYVGIFLVYTFFNLQGFWNCIIFMRPRVMKWKEAEPGKSWFWCYRQVLSGYPPSMSRQIRNAGRFSGRRGARLSSIPSSECPETKCTEPSGSVSLQFQATSMPLTQVREETTDASSGADGQPSNTSKSEEQNDTYSNDDAKPLSGNEIEDVDRISQASNKSGVCSDDANPSSQDALNEQNS